MLKGGCYCGAIKYEIHGKLLMFVNCHCPDCRKFSGSAFSAVVVSRALVNLLFGSRRKLESLPIGQVWKPDAPVISIATKLER